MKKLIVTRGQAQTLMLCRKDCIIYKHIRVPKGRDIKSHIEKVFPIGAKFWVAEPMVSITDGWRRRDEYQAELPVEGWRPYTLARPGSRVHFGEHRFVVEVVSCVDANYPNMGEGWATVLLKLKVSNK